MEVFREILFLIVMAWSIPNLIFFLIKLIKKNPKIFPIIISVIISIVGLVFSITFLKNIDFFETIGKKDISEKETTNNKNSIGGDDYYWLQAPKESYKLKINEEIKIPIEICTPNEIHFKHRLYKKIIELTESKEFKYKISLWLNDFHPSFSVKHYVEVPYLVFCNDFSINKHGTAQISVIYENHSQPESKVYLDEKYEMDVWKGEYEEIVDLKTNTVLTSKELKAFLNQEENREKI